MSDQPEASTPRKYKSNVVRLVSYKMSRDAIPEGGGLADGIKFLSSKESVMAGFKDASQWVKDAIQAVRNAAEPNPWKNSTDEEIAGEIVRKLEESQR